MADSPVLYHKRDSIVTLTLNRPETLNAMNEAMMAELERLLIGLETDATVRAVILTGAGRAFSSGGDQKRARDAEGQQLFFDGDLGGGVIERLHRCVLRLQRLAKPVIGSINGVAVGAGCNIALAADLRLASDAARFGEVFTRVGLVPDGGGTYFLPRLVGTAKAMELMLLADIIDAQEALRLGLVNWVVPADQLQDETQKLAERLAQGPTLAYGLVKTGLYQSLTMPLEDVLNMEARNQAMAARSQDRAEGVAAFREKRRRASGLVWAHAVAYLRRTGLRQRRRRRGMRRWLTVALLAGTMWLCICAASAGSVSPNSWRPYIDSTVLVTLGMSKGEVLVKAGQPATTELVSAGTDGHLSITVWTYIRTGHNEEVANLTFSGNKLVKIELNLLKP